ncbi:hypothetical protein CASFOL_029686 [Castilleja foliolosa]|uniref:Glycosyltransferase n=1 Tax=Castilleja foliolosa TaxID=1961234 RepID=A0ABD3C987_9LAMI
MEKQTKFSILMFPWLAYSHVFPYLELAKQLSKNKHFHIYFCSSAINLDYVKKHILSNQSSIELVQLHVPSSPELPPHLHTTKNLPAHLNPALLRAFQASSSSFSEILSAIKPDLLIYDFFQPWAPKLALSQNIPSVYFATSGAAPFSFFHHLYTHGPSSPFPYPEIYLFDHEKVDIRAKVVEHPVKEADNNYFAFGNFELSSEIVLIKSFKGLEDKYINYLSRLCNKKVVPTGPLVAGPDYERDDEGEWLEIVEWLDAKDRCSTVFVCFGSEHFLPRKQIIEVAKGLEISGANFIWAVRFSDEGDELPEGFLERVKGKGMVLPGWAPQGKILAHPSVGGFVSHCGWSSVMESLYFGVPIIGVPIKFDQPLNGRLVVEAGAGVEVEKDGNGEFVADEVAKAIKKVVMEESGESLRFGAKILREKMEEEEERAIDEVTDQLLNLCKTKSLISS